MDILVSSRKSRMVTCENSESPRLFPRHDGNTFAVRLDSRRLRQVVQSEIGRLNKSILMPDPISLA